MTAAVTQPEQRPTPQIEARGNSQHKGLKLQPPYEPQFALHASGPYGGAMSAGLTRNVDSAGSEGLHLGLYTCCTNKVPSWRPS